MIKYRLTQPLKKLKAELLAERNCIIDINSLRIRDNQELSFDYLSSGETIPFRTEYRFRERALYVYYDLAVPPYKSPERLKYTIELPLGLEELIFDYDNSEVLDPGSHKRLKDLTPEEKVRMILTSPQN